MNRKVSITFAVSVVVLVGGFLAAVFLTGSNTQTIEPAVIQRVASKAKVTEKMDTSDWYLYQNKKFGYEMKYPKDWAITTLGNVPAADFSAPAFESLRSYEIGEKIHPSLMINEIHTTTAGETIETGMPSGAGDYRLIDEKRVAVAGKDAFFVEYFQNSYGRRNGKSGLVRQEIKVINGNTSYTFLIDEENEDADVLDSSMLWKNKAVFEAMVGSFRFLGGDQSAGVLVPGNSAQGVIYTNNEFGFSVNLPVGWEKYQVSVQRDKGDDKHTYIYFMMPTADKSVGSLDKNTGEIVYGMADIFAITATDTVTWNNDANSKACKESPDPSCPDVTGVIGKNSKYVFSASYGNGLLPDDVQKFMVEKSAATFLSGKFQLL